MISVLLFIVAIVLTVIMTPIALLYTAIDPIFDLLGRLALSIDMAGNVLLARPMNDLLKTKHGYKFGNRKETISSVLGKNKRDKTLTILGISIANILDFIEKDHCIKSIDDMI